MKYGTLQRREKQQLLKDNVAYLLVTEFCWLAQQKNDPKHSTFGHIKDNKKT